MLIQNVCCNRSESETSIYDYKQLTLLHIIVYQRGNFVQDFRNLDKV